MNLKTLNLKSNFLRHFCSLKCHTYNTQQMHTSLTLLNGFNASQHSGSEHKQAAGLVELHLAHNAERRPEADGHHRGVLEDVVLFPQNQRRDRQREQWRRGVDHLRERKLHIIESHVPKRDAGAERQAQQEHFAFGAGGQVLLADAFVPDDPAFDQPVVHHYRRQHVQGRQQQRVSEVVDREDPFVEAGYGGARHEPHGHGEHEVQHFWSSPASLAGVMGLLALGGAAIGADHGRFIFAPAGQTHLKSATNIHYSSSQSKSVGIRMKRVGNVPSVSLC